MLTEKEKQTLRKNLIRYEGDVRHMYLDTEGYVTIGVGHLVPNLAAALKLNLVVGKTGAIATEAQITIDYESVKKQPKGGIAYTYKKYTQLIMTGVEVNRLTNKHIKTFCKELKKLFPDFDDYPTEARLGLLDMIFNLGMTRLKGRFPKFCKAVKEKNWAAAAVESNRPDIQPPRNKYVRELFEVVAENVSTENRNANP
ncbi:MAG: hypothetical protein L3J98_10250 [Gammaproteobacteria bacterium]|nr:hypothetical protein [Gammaproteobacteria bacterium]MCF6260517.1 hypothetical protein [Gammaproteobacteria bacterium]